MSSISLVYCDGKVLLAALDCFFLVFFTNFTKLDESIESYATSHPPYMTC